MTNAVGTLDTYSSDLIALATSPTYVAPYGALQNDKNVEQQRPIPHPTDNPFQGAGQVPQVYAYGFRNPCRFSFDRPISVLPVT